MREIKMLGVRETAEYYHISEYFVRSLVKQNKVKACRIGTGRGKILINVQSVDDYFNSCSVYDDTTSTHDTYGIQPIDF